MLTIEPRFSCPFPSVTNTTLRFSASATRVRYLWPRRYEVSSIATALTADRSASATARSTYRLQIACTRCHDTPVSLATAAKLICWAIASTSASNSSVKPESLPNHSGSTSTTRPSGSFTRGVLIFRTSGSWAS